MNKKLHKEFQDWHLEQFNFPATSRSTAPGQTDHYEHPFTNGAWEAYKRLMPKNDIYRHYKGETYRYISDATLEWCADDYVATPDGAVRRFEKIDRDDTCCGGFMDLFGVHRPGCDGDRE